MEGSLARVDAVPSTHVYPLDLRARLIHDGVLAVDGTHLRFTQSYAFNLPSTAAGVILGRSANGRVEWKDEQGRSLKEAQQAALA